MPAAALSVPVQGETLHVGVHRAARPRGTLLYVHGFLSDGREFGEAAGRLAAEGWNGAVLDLRGHGRSTGPRGYASARIAVEDLAASFAAVKKEGLAGPYGVVAHSGGVPLAFRFLTTAPEIAAGAFVTPLSRLLDQVGTAERAAYLAAIRLNRLVTRLGLPSIKVPYKYATRSGYRKLYVDPEAAARAHRDGILQTKADTAWATDMLALDGAAWAGDVKVPGLFVLATEDRVLKAEECQKVVAAYAGEKRVVELASGHSAFGDVKREELFRELARWFDERLPRA